MDNDEICYVFRRLAIEAGLKIMNIYDQNNFEINIKSDDSPVTIADEAADKIIYQGLQEAFPTVPIVTEEQANTHTEKSNTFFIVDPLDGTKEFIHRRGDFTVNIAYVENGIPVMGIVYAPAKKRLFYTDKNFRSIEEIGPHKVDELGDLKHIKVSKPNLNQLIVVASKSHRDKALEDYIAKYNVSDSRAAGSSLKFCLIAVGEADLYPRVGRTMEWDTAAGQAICMHAGFDVIDWETQKSMRYNRENLLNNWFLVK